MDDEEQAIARDVAAAAAVHAAKREVDGAIAALAASPLDEAAADRMREVLASSKLRTARRVLSRLQPPRSPRLSVATDPRSGREETREEADPEENDRARCAVAAGGAA